MKQRLCRITWGASAPRFLPGIPELSSKYEVVLLSEVTVSRSEAITESKDLVLPRGETGLARNSSGSTFSRALCHEMNYAAFFLLPSNLLSTRIPRSTCFSSIRNGGRNRTTVSCVLLNSTPSAKPASTIGRAGISS